MLPASKLLWFIPVKTKKRRSLKKGKTLSSRFQKPQSSIHKNHHLKFMPPPRNSHHRPRLFSVTLLCLFIGMEASLLGMFNERSNGQKKTASSSYQSGTPNNRRQSGLFLPANNASFDELDPFAAVDEREPNKSHKAPRRSSLQGYYPEESSSSNSPKKQAAQNSSDHKQQEQENSSLECLQRIKTIQNLPVSINISADQEESTNQDSSVLYEAYLAVPSSILENRRCIFSDNEKAIKETNGNFEKIKSIATSLLAKIAPQALEQGNRSAPSQQEKELINDVRDLVRDSQLFILGSYAPYHINKSKEELDKIEEMLIPMNKKPLEDSSTYGAVIIGQQQQAKKLLEQCKAQFSLRETTSAKAMVKVAQESSDMINSLAGEAQSYQKAFIQESEHAYLNNCTALAEAAESMEELHNKLQKAMLYYVALEGEARIEEDCGELKDLHEKIQAKMQKLQEKMPASEATESPPLLDELNSMLVKSYNDDPSSYPQAPSEFLAIIKKFAEDLNSEKIIEIHGKVALDNTSTARKEVRRELSEKSRKEWMAGINLIRLAICKDFGFHIMQAFDHKFSIKINEKNPLQVGELKDFWLANQELRYQPGFFIDPQLPHVDFLAQLEALSSTRVDKIIRIDQATLAFNPFDKKRLDPAGETLDAAELRQRKAGFEYVREALKLAFPEASLSEEQLGGILNKFDEKYKIINIPDSGKTLLTLHEAFSFIKTEKEILQERGCWERYVTRNFDYLSLQVVSNGIYYGFGTAFGSNLFFAACLVFSYLCHYHAAVNATS